MYVEMNTLGNILQLSTALAKCISLAYGFTPKSLIEVSTSKSTLIFCFGSATFTSSIIFPLFVFLLSSRFLLLYVALIVQHIFPSPTVTYFLTHVENIYGIALKQNWSYKNSPGYHVRGLSKKIR